MISIQKESSKCHKSENDITNYLTFQKRIKLTFFLLATGLEWIHAWEHHNTKENANFTWSDSFIKEASVTKQMNFFCYASLKLSKSYISAFMVVHGFQELEATFSRRLPYENNTSMPSISRRLAYRYSWADLKGSKTSIWHA